MRRKIYDIYKALRHFGVTPDEVEGIAHAYKRWLHFSFDASTGNTKAKRVYCCNNKFFALPFWLPKLEHIFVGHEVDGVIFLKDEEKIRTRHAEIKDKLEEFKVEFSKKYLNNAPLNLEVRSPTVEELRAYNAIYCNWNFDTWITPSAEHPDRTFSVTSGMSVRTHRHSEETIAYLHLVAVPKEEDIFIGELDYYGIPDFKTEKVCDMLSVYVELLNTVEK